MKAIIRKLDPHYIIDWLLNQKVSHVLSDKMYIRLRYWVHMKKKLHINPPVTFNEKLQWLKLFGNKDEYTKMADKESAKEYVAEIIGRRYIIPTLGVWSSFKDIDFEQLPNKFVLKCTHNSGGVIICSDKNHFDKVRAEEVLSSCLSENFYYEGREKQYKNIIPQIIAEQYMEDKSGALIDYKVHVFNGIPKFILVCSDRFAESGLSEDFYDTDWNHMDVQRPNHRTAGAVYERPAMLEDMLRFASILAGQIPFLRVDYYVINDQLYFGELTFFPADGMAPFEPESWDYTFGNWLTLPSEMGEC